MKKPIKKSKRDTKLKQMLREIAADPNRARMEFDDAQRRVLVAEQPKSPSIVIG